MFKFVHRYFRGRWERYYLKSHWHLILDLSLAMVILILTAMAAWLYLYRPAIDLSVQTRPQAVDLDNPPLELSYQVANSTYKDEGPVVLKVIYKNNGSQKLDNVAINLSSLTDGISVSGIDSSASNPAVDGRNIVFASIDPDNGGEAELKVYFKRKDQSSRTIDWQAQNEYYVGDQLLKSASKLPTLKIAAQLKAKAAVYYTSPQGDQLGIGPLPPIVGIPTNYWLFLETSANGDFKDLTISGRLPKGVELAEGRSLLAGELNYGTSSRLVIWKLPTLKGNDNSYRAGFEIKLVPTAGQVGQVLPLINDLRYSGIDSQTGLSAKGTLETLTTNLETDSFNSGQGKVLEQ